MKNVMIPDELQKKLCEVAMRSITITTDDEMLTVDCEIENLFKDMVQHLYNVEKVEYKEGKFQWKN